MSVEPAKREIGLRNLSAGAPREPVRERDVMRRVLWRTAPLFCALYMMSIIDRSNIGFAKLQMVDDLGMTEVAFGLGASLYFIGATLFELPSAWFGVRYGARKWLARIAMTWGLVTICLAFTTGPASLYGLRFLLGAAEAGLYPVIIFYITIWYPQRYRTQAFGMLTLGSALGNTFTALAAGPLLGLDGVMGLGGWQWVFIVTGIPAVLLAPVVWFALPNRPSGSRFLTQAQQTWLVDEVAASASPREIGKGGVLAALFSPLVLAFAALNCVIAMTISGVIYWIPTVIRSLDVSTSSTSLLVATPWAFSALALLLVTRQLTSTERVLRTLIGLSLLGMMSAIGGAFLATGPLRFTLILISIPCASLTFPCFWYLTTRLFSAKQAATAIAAISTLGGFGGFFAQNLMPVVAQVGGNAAYALLVPAAANAVVICFALGYQKLASIGSRHLEGNEESTSSKARIT